MIKELINREPVIPIYPLVTTNPKTSVAQGMPRIITGTWDTATIEIIDGVEEGFTADDIVYVPLYEHVARNRDKNQQMGLGTCDKLPCYEKNLAWAKNIAPYVAGISVGNAMCELSFKDLLCYGQPSKKIQYHAFAQYTIDFIAETADLIAEIGGKQPYYGIVDWDVAIDCYFCGSIINDVMNAVNAINLIYCGMQLVDGTVPSESDAYYFPMCPIKDVDKTQLKNHIESGQYWSGVMFVDGLKSGNDQKLKDFGFKAGILGYY